jgi:uroporphyrinogen decarboxylase
LPLIGFAGSPFTLACYMIEGCGSADFGTVRRMAYRRPDLLHRLVAINARAVTAYLNEQIRAGADALMLFDTWGGMLTTDAFRSFSLASMRSVLAALAPGADGGPVPTIAFTKGGGQWLDDLAACGASCVGLDWTSDLAAARRRVGTRVALQGNLDPLVLLTDPIVVQREAVRVLRAAGPAPGHIFNLGHGIVPATPPENVAALIEAVHRETLAARASA